MQTGLHVNTRMAYEKLTANVDLDLCKVKRTRKKCKIYLTMDRVKDGSIVWECEISINNVRKRYIPGHQLGEPTRTFEVQNDNLTHMERVDPPQVQTMQRIIMGLPRVSTRYGAQLHYVAKLNDNIVVMEGYSWRDGKGIFETTSAHLQRLFNPTPINPHINIQKWRRYTNWTPMPRLLLHDTWQDFRADKINCFTWKLLHWIPTTNVWRWPKLPPTNPDTHCKRCTVATLEDANHLFWDCPKVATIWNWV